MNKQFLSKVTITGADDSVDAKDLIRISEEYPFVEWGILQSKNSTRYRRRFPSLKWIEEFSDLCLQSEKTINVSGHLCGEWVEQIFLGRWVSLEVPRNFSLVANRWQLNTHGVKHNCNIDRFLQIIKAVNTISQQIIFQFDEANNEPLIAALNKNLNVSALYDLSHGEGILPVEWKLPTDSNGNLISTTMPIGFAGGLSPDNVNGELEKISKVVNDFYRLLEKIAKLKNQNIDWSVIKGLKIWIDVETLVRSSNNEKFDLIKVLRFLEQSKPYVIME